MKISEMIVLRVGRWVLLALLSYSLYQFGIEHERAFALYSILTACGLIAVSFAISKSKGVITSIQTDHKFQKHPEIRDSTDLL